MLRVSYTHVVPELLVGRVSSLCVYAVGVDGSVSGVECVCQHPPSWVQMEGGVQNGSNLGEEGDGEW